MGEETGGEGGAPRGARGEGNGGEERRGEERSGEELRMVEGFVWVYGHGCVFG